VEYFKPAHAAACFKHYDRSVFICLQDHIILVNEVAELNSAKSVQKVGKYGTPTRCNNNSFIDLQDQLNMFRASFCPSSGAQD
jgi:hypothetical protein